MKKRLLSAAIVSMTLTGCFDNENVEISNPGGVKPPTDVLPPTDIIPPSEFTGKLYLGQHQVLGEVICNGETLAADGSFPLKEAKSFTCRLGTVELAQFTTQFANGLRASSFVYDIVSAKGAQGEKAAKVLTKIDADLETGAIELNSVDSYQIKDVYNRLDDDKLVNDFVDNGIIPPTDLEPPAVVPPTDIIPPSAFTGKLYLGAEQVIGEVECNGQTLSADGSFLLKGVDTFTCSLGAVELAKFNAQSSASLRSNSFVYDIVSAKAELGVNAEKVLKRIDGNPATPTLELQKASAYEIANVYTQLDNEQVVSDFVDKGIIPPTDLEPPTVVIPPTDIIPPSAFTGKLYLGQEQVLGEVTCNGQTLSADGSFKLNEVKSFSCSLGPVELAQFSTFSSSGLRLNSFVYDIVNAKGELGANAARVLGHIDSDKATTAIDLKQASGHEIANVYTQLDNEQVVSDFVENGIVPPTDLEPPAVVPPTDIIPPSEFTGKLYVGQDQVLGEVSCNGQPLAEDGSFKLKEVESFSCLLGPVVLAEFSTHSANGVRLNSFVYDIVSAKGALGAKASKVLKKIDSVKETSALDLMQSSGYDILNVYNNLANDEIVNDFVDNNIVPPTDLEPPVVVPPTDIIPPSEFTGKLYLGSNQVFGEVVCNGETLAADGSFKLKEVAAFSCFLGPLELADFTNPSASNASEGNASASGGRLNAFVFDIIKAKGELGANAARVLTNIDSDKTTTDIELKAASAYEILNIYSHLDNNDIVNDFVDNGVLPPTDLEPPVVVPPTDIIPPAVYNAKLTLGGQVIKGDVICNNKKLDNGLFDVGQGQAFSCTLGSVDLGDFIAPFPQTTRTESPTDKIDHSFNLVDLHGANVSKVLQTINSCELPNTVCLTEFDSIDIQDIYHALDNNAAVEQFVEFKNKQKEEEATDEVNKAPSSHVDADIKPVETPGVSTDLNNDFVSASAEETYAYKPSTDSRVLTQTRLTDAEGRPLAGISFFSAGSRGVTGANGEFEFLWGDELTFGIDTFEFGAVKGNKLTYKITDVTENPVEKANIQALLERYGQQSSNRLQIGENVTDVFSQYPNVINELINLRLPNGGLIDGSDGMTVPDEFDGQFSSGLTAIIDAQLNPNGSSSFSHIMRPVYRTDNGTYVTDSLNEIFNGVNTFHVFHDNQGGYGATGWVRANRSLNLSNRAFPVMMDRNDRNRQLGFGERQAWTREGKPYLVEHPSIEMLPIPTVNKDTVTYGLPFVTAGEIGKGKVVFMGNSMYPSILSCPDVYWAGSEFSISSATKTCTPNANITDEDGRSDNGDMQRYFTNLFNWFTPGGGQHVATNIERGAFAMANADNGRGYDFFIHDVYKLGSVTEVTSGGFGSLDPTTTPILILQAYGMHGGMNNNSANLNAPKLTTEDVTALIKYINDGGNVLFMDGIASPNPEPIGRLADAAGISVGGPNVASITESNCDPGDKRCNKTPKLNQMQEKDVVVLQRFDNLPGTDKPPFTVNPDGSLTWASAADMLKAPFHVPQYKYIDSAGGQYTRWAQIRVTNEQERAEAIAELQEYFPGTPVCTNDYEFEFNCIDFRKGTGIKERAYGRSDFERVKFEVSSMVKAANLGSNVQALADHELYYRTKGKQGVRLPITELNQTYDNLSTWLWNNNDYRYESEVQDELGFKRLVEYMNCYTDNRYGGNADCPVDLKNTLVANGMVYGADKGDLAGFMNPSYPLNYQEKPLTRIMLGRSYWDYRIKVDTTSYPTRPDSTATTSGTVSLESDGSAVTFSAGNNQSTGYWLPQHVEGSVTGDTPAMITVMFADDLTGRAQHETSLKRPPRMTTTFKHNGGTTKINTPYGGLVYIQPLSKNGLVEYSLSNVIKAPLYKDGAWVVAPEASSVKLAEVDTGSFVYTTHVNNLTNTDLETFIAEMNRFADASSDFYGRDSIEGKHRRFTYPDLKGFRHRFVNDVQISIGAAHSGYPVMNNGFSASSTTVPTKAKDDWLLWHEVGHNLAAAPFMAAGSTEVTNNLLALYMQELEGRNDNPQMDRIVFDIQKAPMWLSSNAGHAWANANAGMRLVMFGQLKMWAKTHFDIDAWYTQSGATKASIYGKDQGWNMFKLMHRLARDGQDKLGDINYCSGGETGLSGADLMMVCSSYVAQADLSEFFANQWNVGESSSSTPDGQVLYSGGISAEGLSKLAEMGLEKPETGPEAINSIH